MDIYVQKDGQQLGPLTETKIRQGIDAGEFVPADLAWASGKASWQPLAALIDLDLNQPPPLLSAEAAFSEPTPQETKSLELPSVPTATQVVTPAYPAAPYPPEITSSFGRRPCTQCSTPYNLFSPMHAWGSGLCRRCYKAKPTPVRESVLDRPISNRQNALKAVQATAILYVLLGIFNIVMTRIGWLDSFYLGCTMIVASFALWIWHSRTAAVILFLMPIVGTAYIILIGAGQALLDAGYWNGLTIMQTMLAWNGVVSSFKLHREFAQIHLPAVKTDGVLIK